MSREIDERIVQMKFDNTLFERNVATSIGTLEKLKAALDFSGATNSLNNIERNVNAADFSKLSSNIEAISSRFSNWGVVGMTVIQDLTRAAENLGLKMYNATIGQIKSGGWSRATNIDKAKFAIEGLNQSWEELSKSIDKAVTDTRFGFDEAATAASQLVASNVAVGEEMDNALKSIANVASQTGDEYSSIAHIYTTIAGNGKMMTEQLNMFSYRGLNVASMMAKVWGKTEAEVREMATKGEISFKMFSDAMNEALGEGAKRANDTFEGSMANMKAALSRIGQPFAASYRKYMPPVFNNLKERIKEIKTALKPIEDVFDDLMKRTSDFVVNVIQHIDLSWVTNLVNGITKVYNSILGINGVATPLIDTIKEKAGDAYNFFYGIFEKLYPAAAKVKDTTDKLTKAAENVKEKMGPVFTALGEFADPFEKASKMVNKSLDKALGETEVIAKTAEKVDEVAKRVIAGEFGNGQARFDALAAAGENWKIIQNRVNEMLGCNYRYEVSQEELNAAFGETNELLVLNNKVTEKKKSLFEKLGDWLLRLADMVRAAFAQIDMEYVIGRATYIVAGFVSAFELIGKTVGTVIDAGLGPFTNVLIAIGYLLLDTASSIGEWLMNLRNAADASGFFDKLHDVLIVIFETISIIATDATNWLATAISGVGTAFSKIGETILGTWTKVKETFATFKETDTFKSLADSFDRLKTRFVEFKTQVFDAFQKQLDKFRNSEIKLPKIDTEKLGKFFSDVAEKITQVFDWLTDKLDVHKFTQVFDILADAFGTVASVVKGTLTSAFGVASTIFGIVIGKVRLAIEAIKTFFGSFKESKGLATFKENLVEIGKRLNDLRIRAGKALDGIFKKLKNTKKNLPTAKIKEFGAVVGNVFQKISEFVIKLLSKINIEAVIEGIAKALSTIGSILSKVAKIVGGIFITAFKMAGPVLSKVFELIKSGIEIVKGFWDSFKDSKAFEGIKGIASTVGGWIGDLIENVQKGEFKLPEINGETLKQSFESIKGWFGERWEGLKGWFGEKWEGIKAWFKEKWESLFSASNEEGEESGFKLPELDTTSIEQSIDKFLEWLHTKVDTIKKTLISFLTGKEYDEVSEAAAEMPDIGDFMLNDKTEDYDWDQKHPVLAFLKHLAGALLGLAGDTVIAGLDVLDRLVLLIEDHFPTISGILNDMLGGSLGIVEDFVNRINASEDAQDKIAAIRGIIAEVGKTILTFKSFKAAFGILNFFTGLGNITKSIREAIDQFKKFMKSLTKTMKATTRALNALAILEIAAAVLAMAGAFKLLGSLTWDQFKVAAASIGVITAALAILFLTLNAGNTNGGNKLVQTPLTYLVDALKQFGAGLNKALRRIGTAAMILSFVYAVRTIIDIVKELTNYTWADAHQGVELMTVVIGEIVGAIKALNFGNGKKTFGNQIGVAAELIALAIAIKSIANALIKLGDVPPEKLEAAEAAINNIMWLAMKLTLLGGNDSFSTNDGKGKGPFGWHSGDKSKFKRNTKWKTILATAALIWVVGNALCKLAHCNKEKLAAASEAMAAVMETCVGVMAAAAFISDSSSGSKVSGDITRHGLGKMFLSDKSNYSKEKNTSKENSAFKNILATIGLLVVVSYALVRLSKCKPEKLAAASEAIAGIVNACTGLLLATTIISDKDAGNYFDGDTLFGHKKKGKYNKSNNSAWKSMLGIIGIVWVVGNAIKGLSDMDADKIEAAGNAIAKIALVCVGIIAASSFVENGEMGNVREGGLMSKIFGNVKGAKKHTTSVASVFQSFVPVVAAVLSAAGAIYGLRDVDVATIDAAGDAVAKIALACSAIIAASGFMNFLTGDESALNQVIGGFVAAGTIFESVLVAKDAIAGLASMDVDAEKLKVSGEALFDALAGIAVVLLGTGSLVALGALGSGSGLIVAGIMAVIGLIISLVDQFAPGWHNFLYGVEGAAEGSEEAVGYLDRLVNAFNAIGRMINGFVSGLLGTENVGDDIKQAAGDMSTGLTESISGLGDSLSGAIEEIKGINLPQMFDDMGLGEIPGKLTDFAADLKLFLAETKGITKKDLDPLDETLKALLKIIGVEFIIDLVNTLDPNDNSGVVAMITNLNDNFFENFKTFCENAKSELDPEALSSLQKLVEVLEGVAKATFIGNLAWLIGEEGLEELAVSLTDFVEQMDQYNEAIKDKNWAFGKWALVSTCCKSMIEVANMAPRTGGIYDAIFGKEDMEGFGASVLAFIGSMVDANTKLTDVTFNQDGFEAAAAAATPMNDLAFALEKTGGIVQAIIGIGDLELFGQKVAAFVESMVTASGTIGDGSQFNESAFETVAKCGEYLATLEKNLPPTGGKLQEWMGHKNISVFGTRVKMFIQNMTEASDILEQNPIDSEALTALADLGTMFSTLESTLEAQDGLKQWLEGQKDIGDFGYDLETFAMKMVRFSDLIRGKAKNAGDVQGHAFSNRAVSTAVETLEKLWDFVKKVQAAGLAEQGAALTGLTKGTEGFITAANWVLEFYNQIGAEILSDKNFDESGVLTSLNEAGEKLAGALIDGMKAKLESLDEKTKESSIPSMIYKALYDSIMGNATFEKNVTANGRWIGTSLIDGLNKVLSEDEEGTTFPSFVKAFVRSFQDMIYRILTSMTNASPTFKTKAENWMKSLKSGIDAYRAAIISWLLGIPSTVLSNYGFRNPDFYRAGYDWMMSLYNGINVGSISVYDLANGIASDISNIIGGAVDRASSVPSGLMLSTDSYYTFGDRSTPMFNAMNSMAKTGLRTATALEGAMNTASSNGEMAFQQLQSVAGIQNGAFSLSRDASSMADTAAASMSRTASLAKSASISSPVMNQVYVKDSNDTLEALNGMRRDIKVLTENMANIQMVLDSGVLVGQLTPGLDVTLKQRTRMKERWA